jgi:DNA-binding LacI/PurR family transcriptional regulator
VRGVAVIKSSSDDAVISSLTKEGIAVVLCNLLPADRFISNIRIDYESGLNQAMEHVASLGHRRAAVIGGPATNKTAARISGALVEGLQRRGLDPNPVTHSTYHIDAAASAVQLVLAASEKPTVIFCGSDLIAMGAMLALEAEGIDVPRDISIVGIDDIPFASLTRPPLTTIGVPREKLGITAFQALEKMLKLKRQKGAEYVLETELVIRKSTAPRAGDPSLS